VIAVASRADESHKRQDGPAFAPCFRREDDPPDIRPTAVAAAAPAAPSLAAERVASARRLRQPAEVASSTADSLNPSRP